LRVLYSL